MGRKKHCRSKKTSKGSLPLAKPLAELQNMTLALSLIFLNIAKATLEFLHFLGSWQGNLYDDPS